MNRLRLFVVLALMLPTFGRVAQAQVFTTKAGMAHFFSDAPMEDIEATTHSAECAMAAKSGQISARIKMTTFEFDKALMQRHFNENYVESDKYPYANLEGKLADPLPLDKDGTFPVIVQAKLTIHGVSKDYTIPGQIEVKDGKPVRATAKWNVALADHKIEIPSIVGKNLAEIIAVDVDFPLELRK